MSGLLPHSISMNAIVVAVVSCPAPKNVTKSSKAASRSNSGSFAENAFNFISIDLHCRCDMWKRGKCKFIQHVLLAFSINCARQSSLAWRIVKNSFKKMRNKIAYLLNVKTQLIGIVFCGNDTFVATNLGQYIFGHGFSSVYPLGSFMQKFSPCLSQKSD